MNERPLKPVVERGLFDFLREKRPPELRILVSPGVAVIAVHRLKELFRIDPHPERHFLKAVRGFDDPA